MNKNSWERHRGPRNRSMDSFKNSEQARKIREWRDAEIKSLNMPLFEAQNKEWARDDWQNSPAYLAAKRKALKDKIQVYAMVACAIAVAGILMFWP